VQTYGSILPARIGFAMFVTLFIMLVFPFFAEQARASLACRIALGHIDSEPQN